MKVNLNKIFLAIALTVFSVLNFTGCQDEIFHEIRDEIELDDSTVSGHINSIVRYKSGSTEYIVTQNGNVYYREKSPSQKIWIHDSTPRGNVTKLAADENYLYALYTNWEEDTDEGEWVRGSTKIVAKNSISGAWSDVHTVNGDVVVSLFCTNSATPSHRKAYVRIGSQGVYELDGTTWPSSSMTLGSSTRDTTPTTSTNSCAFLVTSHGNEVYFSNGYSATSNADDSKIYFASGDIIYYTGDGTFSSVDVNSDTIYSMSYTSDYLCLGTDSGFQAAPLSAGVPNGSSTDNFSNAESTLSSYYEVWAILAVDPADTMSGNVIFASLDYSGSSSSTSAVFDNIGLWGYYSSRGNWNRE